MYIIIILCMKYNKDFIKTFHSRNSRFFKNA